MILYVMRHGPAEDRAASGRDADRRLTPRGRVLVASVAAAFQEARRAAGNPAAPLRILASPRRRAEETATIVRSLLTPQPSEIEIREELGGEAPIPLSFIAEATTSGTDTILVGHQPVVEELVKDLLHGAPGLPGFSTATIVGLVWTAEPATWTLTLHLDPARLPG